MSDRCMEFREMNPGGREMVTSGGEREERRAWTHDRRKAYSNYFIPTAISILNKVKQFCQDLVS